VFVAIVAFPLLAPALLAALLFAAKSIFVVLTPLQKLAMTPWLIDDSFISMQIARNIAAGRGYSFDGVVPTTGSSFLWPLFTSLNHIGLGREAAAKLTLIESAFFGALATLLLFQLAHRLHGPAVAWGSFVLCTFSPPMFLNSLNGMETSLFTFIGLAAISYFVSGLPMIGMHKASRSFALGALIGLANLVRGDGIFLAAAILGVSVWRWSRQGLGKRKEYAPAMGAMIAGIAFLTLPLVIWSARAGGSLAPANQIGRRYLALELAGLLNQSATGLAYWRHAGENVLELGNLISVMVGSSLLALLALLLLDRSEPRNRFAGVLLVFLATYLGSLVMYQFYFPDVHGLRYLQLPAHLLSIPLLALVRRSSTNRWLSRNLQGGAFVIMVGLLVLASGYQYRRLTLGLYWTKGRSLYPAYTTAEVRGWWSFLDWSAAHLPEGSVVAAMDHGRLAYFTGARVVDLAGIIDSDLWNHLLRGDADAYLRGKGIQYAVLSERDNWLVFRVFRASFRLREVEDAPQQEATGYSLFRVEP
jgi:hypothetical protein